MKTEEILIRQDISFAPAVWLKAGLLTVMYESGRIRYIKTNAEEILRMIYPAVRDENWNTILPVITGESVEESRDSFSISYRAEYKSGNIHYTARFFIKGNDSGKIVFHMEGESLSDFRSRRIGMCVHHAIAACAGKAVEILNHENKTLQHRFPVRISPHQPFTDIKAMSWRSAQHQVTLEFAGDRFETEDQRNWTDDSFKTYSGPLDSVPMLEIRKGDRLEQTVTLIITAASGPVIPATAPVAIETRVRFPAIGYQRSHHQQPLTPADIRLLQLLPFDHYRVDLYVSDPAWKEILQSAAQEARDLGTRLELVIFFSSLAVTDIEKVAGEIAKLGGLTQSLLILAEKHDVPPKSFFLTAQERLHEALPDVQIGYGTNGNFAELNRNLPGDLPCDFVCFPAHPQVHFIDSRSILENLGSQHATIDTLRHSLSHRNMQVSPVTLQSRMPYGDVAEVNDPRQHTNFAAWWMLNTISNFCDGGHLTFFELIGERGLIRNSASTGERESPVFQILQKIKNFAPAFVIRTNMDAVCLENDAGERLLFRADFSPETLK